jgi:hydrogenase nickel incorporation protein HypA/HybF
MHELSIAQNILEIVKQNVPAPEFGDVRSIKVRLGEFAGVVPESLEFCFEAITADTELAGAGLDIEKIPFMVECKSCGETSTNNYGMSVCQKCGGADTKIISGLEMQVVEIELNEVVSEDEFK